MSIIENPNEALVSQNQTILMVDDTPANLAVVGDYLAQQGYQVMVALTGETGISLAQEAHPDLILLDVLLPGIDGFETCRRLKADERTRDIPVIFMTIVTRTEDKVRGFEAGGVDYITKPFQHEEVLARVTTHLRIRELTRKLEEAKESLELRVVERTSALAQTNVRLKEEIAERKKSEEALQRLNRELSAIRNCNQVLVRADDEQTLLNDICRIICDEAGYRLAWVGYVEHDEAKTVRPVAWGGFDDGYVTNAKISWADDAERAQGPGGTAIRSGETAYTQDFTLDLRLSPWRESALQRGYRSAIALPLKDGDANVFGVLLIYSMEINAFTPDERQLLEELAGDLAFGIMVLRNRAKRKQAEEALHESEWRYREVFDNVLDSLFLLEVTADGRFRNLEMNPAFEKSTGLSRPQLIGKFIEETVPEEVASIVNAKYRRCVEVGQPIEEEVELDLPAGRRYFYSSLIPARDEAGRVHRIIGISRDITERKQAELEREHLLNQIRQQAKEVQFVIDTVPEAMFLLSENGHVRLTNSMAEQYLALLAPGWETDQLTHLGQYQLADLLTSPPKGLWHDVVLDGWRFELIARPVENGPTNQGWVFVIRDVTREREIQRHVQAQERLAAVGHLAAGIAHDFNNTLAVIKLYTDLLLRTLKLPPRAEERLHILEQQTQRASDLIEQILDFSRQSVVERQPLNLLPFLKELVRLLKRTLPESIDVELEYSKDAYVIHADPSRIQQAIMNLAVNARDAMPEGGHLTIRLTSLQLEPGTSAPVLEMTPGAWIEVGVTDSGTGVPSEVLAHIFEPFFTTKERGQGTGLGLAQVYGIVQQHEGFIGVETEIGRGTTFQLYFPVFAVTWQSRPQPLAAALPQGQGQVVLIVEDEDAIRQALVESLALLNYRILEARNGREALSVLAQHRDEIALVLSDAVMPEMGGVALFYALRQQELAIPFVIVTGHAVEKDMENLRALGLYGWLKKPLELSKLAELLAQGLS